MSQSHSESGAGYKSALAESYVEARRRAKEAYDHSMTQNLENCANEHNLLLVLFLQEARDIMQSKGNENIAKAYGRGAKMLRQYPLRIYNKDKLLQVNGFGPATSNAVEKHLWCDPDCKPPPPGRAELELEQRHFEAKQEQELAQKAAEKQRRADERAAKRTAQQSASVAGGSISSAPDAASPTRHSGGPVMQPQKRQRKSKKEYVPGVGTASYAFLIALLQAQRAGEAFLTKHELINRAEALHITSRPIKGNPNAPIAPGQFNYDGWSSFTALINREPPLAQVYSNPKKCRLTPEGEELARRLYLDAVERQSIAGDPAILDYIHRCGSILEDTATARPREAPRALLAQGQPAGSSMSSEAATGQRKVPAPARKRNRAVATVEAVLPSEGLLTTCAAEAQQLSRAAQEKLPAIGRAAAGSSFAAERAAALAVPRPVVEEEENWDFTDDEQAPPSERNERWSAGGLTRKRAEDADVARLMEMGFTPEQAVKGLAGGRSVAEAVEVIAIDLCDTDDDEPPPAEPSTVVPSFVSSQHANVPLMQRAPPPTLACSGPVSAPPAVGAVSAGSAAAPRLPLSKPLPQPATLAGQRALRAPDLCSQAAEPVTQASSGALRSHNLASLDALVGEGRQHHTQYRLQAAWRLKGVAEGGSAEEADIRLPPLNPGERFADRYQVCLVLDIRERFGQQIRSTLGGATIANKNAEAVERLQKLGISVLSKSMEAGDALWVAQQRGGGAVHSLDTVVERKRVDDLVASIKDGRYERQRYFLARCGMRRTMYLVEGDIDLVTQGPMAKACKTALHRLEVEDGFRVLRTSDSTQTFRLYQRITNALQAKYADLTPESPEVAKQGEPLPSLEQLEGLLRRAKQVTLRDVWGLMLCAVPRISSETCETLLREYPTPVSLWRAYDAVVRAAKARGMDPHDAADLMLTRLPRIGPDTSRAVFRGLFAGGWQG